MGTDILTYIRERTMIILYSIINMLLLYCILFISQLTDELLVLFLFEYFICNIFSECYICPSGCFVILTQ